MYLSPGNDRSRKNKQNIKISELDVVSSSDIYRTKLDHRTNGTENLVVHTEKKFG